MKKIIYIVSALLFMLSSCEKPVEKGEYGNPLIKFYGDALADIGSGIVKSDDGYVLCGTITMMERVINESGGREIVQGSEHKDMCIIFTDNSGVQKKMINIGNPGVDDVGKRALAYNGNFYFVGTTTVEHNGNPDRDVIVVKLSGDGQVLDTWYIGDEFNQEAYDIIPDNSGSGFLICGASSADEVGELDLIVWQVGSDGNVQGTYLRGFEGVDDRAVRIVNDHAGGYLVAGSTYELPGSVLGNNLNIILIKLTNNLEEIDQKIYPSNSNRIPSDIALTGDGGYLISGSSETGGNIFGILLRINTYDPVGFDVTGFSTTLSTQFGSYNSITPLDDNSTYIVAGSYDESLGNLSSSENLFMFIDAEMNKVQDNYITGGIGKQVINDVVEDNGKLVAVGTNGDEFRSLITFLKFDPWKGN